MVSGSRWAGMGHKERIKTYLMEKGVIDPLTAWSELGIYRLASRIFDLRKEMEIDTFDKEVINQFGEPVTVAEYRVATEKNGQMRII